MSGNFDDLAANIAKPGDTRTQKLNTGMSAPEHPSFRDFPPAFFNQPTNPNPDSVKLAEKKTGPQKPASVTNIKNPNVLDGPVSNPFDETLLNHKTGHFANPFSNVSPMGISGNQLGASPKKTPNKLECQIKFDTQKDFSFRKVNPKNKNGSRITTPIQKNDLYANKTKALLNLEPVRISPIVQRSPNLEFYKNYKDHRLENFMSPNITQSNFSNSQKLNSKLGNGLVKLLNFSQNGEYLPGESFRLEISL
jgi:hypothetical protein